MLVVAVLEAVCAGRADMARLFEAPERFLMTAA
jgi:hypothetical protein